MELKKKDVNMVELFNIAVSAYRAGRFDDSIEVLQQIVDAEKQNWLAWFYLGMSYLKSGKTADAYRVMRVVAALCPIEQLRGTASAVLPVTEENIVPSYNDHVYDLYRLGTGTDG